MPPQPPGWTALITLRAGVATVICDNVQTILTPNVALWVPDRRAFALAPRTRSQVRIVYVRAVRDGSAMLAAVRPTALLRELIERAVTCGYLDPLQRRDARLLDVMRDELSALVAEPAAHALVLPRTPVIRAAVERSVAAPEERTVVGVLAAAAGMSERTFLRHFVNETGIPPRRNTRVRSAAIK